MTTAFIKPKTLKLDSFLLNHSREYIIAAIASWVEFFVEWYFFPQLKLLTWFTYIGLAMCVFGETTRKLAMLTAGSNFNHIVQSRQEEGHQLVVHGVYSLWRHPSYVGWFYWSIGTQILLVNPFCVIAYTAASWSFFNSRVEEEELTLLNFFAEDYVEYKKKVGTGLPFISGVAIDDAK